jgi:hypothetical protein
MHVGMHAAFGVSALLALATGLGERLGRGTLAQQQLRHPKCQPLLADTAIAYQQQTGGQSAGEPR